MTSRAIIKARERKRRVYVGEDSLNLLNSVLVSTWSWSTVDLNESQRVLNHCIACKVCLHWAVVHQPYLTFWFMSTKWWNLFYRDRNSSSTILKFSKKGNELDIIMALNLDLKSKYSGLSFHWYRTSHSPVVPLPLPSIGPIHLNALICQP